MTSIMRYLNEYDEPFSRIASDISSSHSLSLFRSLYLTHPLSNAHFLSLSLSLSLSVSQVFASFF